MRATAARWYAAPRAGVIVALIAGLGLAACNGGAVPAAPAAPPSSATSAAPVTATTSLLTSSSAATTASTAPSATSLPYPSDVPAAARVDSPDGAMAFVRHFFGVLNRVYTAPATGTVPPLSMVECKTCANFEGYAADYVANKVRYSPDPLELREISLAPEPAAAGEQNIDVLVRQRPAKGVDATGKVVETLTEKTGVFLVAVRWVDGRWLMRSIKVRV